ncbi:Cache sensor-containing diguanylate cyclase/phosphodiesterase [Aliarcobacter faecis]|uniref:EAL domain-containing protein n=1 Tax=Aliarcobacter faecis TaxID=1564138 RepID=UPI0004B5D684|nr:EAL domain-containing protein [Aliarcobacter faecis]QKF72390.1 Cache sensor-containing diguanylate cyclase/phosphodiesterase [Aliarcobacter faecis]
MNTKLFFKIAWLLIVSLLLYIAFVIFFLSPKINNYLSNIELEISKGQFERIVQAINNESRKYEEKEQLIEQVKLIVSSLTLGKAGYIFIFDDKGKIIFDPSGEFSSKSLEDVIIPGVGKKYLYEEMKAHAITKEPLEYEWNRIYDPYNYNYKKISWIVHNDKFNWYIASNVYKDDFLNFTAGVNSLILNISVLLFGVLTLIGVFITVKIVAPINKMLTEVNKINVVSSLDKTEKSKDEIVYLSKQFNTLVDEVEANRKNIEIQEKVFKNRLYIDSLTGIKNRIALEDDIKNCEFVSIVLIDIDSFADINELYGFNVGDLVLVETAKVLNNFSEKFGVTPYRLYGNVFALVNTTMMNFSRYDEFISESLKVFKEKPIYVEKENLELFINVTLGISIAQEDPVKTATIALNKAKKSNKRFFVYNTEIDTKESIKNSIYWREKIKEAIANDCVIPFFQPIFNTENKIVKYEALMRIKDFDMHGKEIFHLPYLFLDTAFKTKQYLNLVNQMLGKIIVLLPTTEKFISFNISFDDIMNNDFIDMLDKYIDKLDIENKAKLVFEILESDSINEYQILDDFVSKYRKQGIKIAIDDFGTGYSNFAHILKIRPDFIKIDGSLIKNITTDKNSSEMVKSIIDFSKALNIKITAEFVHSVEVYKRLLDLKVDEFQGFYLGRPEATIE